MNRQIIVLYEYNIWANDRVLNHLKSLPSEIFNKEVDLGFKSIAEILGHIVSADEVWFTRIKGESPVSISIKQFNHIDEASNYINALQSQIHKYISSARDIEKKLSYTSAKGEKFQNSVSEIIQHVVNHGTYHRGNITTVLRHLGFNGILTDYIAYLRMNVK